MLIIVPGTPIAQPRQRHAVRAGHAVNYTPSKHPVNDFKAAVKMAWRAGCTAAPHDGPVTLMLTFVLPRPGNMMWKTRPMPRVPHTKKPDADNLAKSVKDALSGLAWRDDSQVCELTVRKFVASGDEQPHTTIGVSA